jgi:ATP-dependent protease HslVU (ClpYQ) peptidase subunit
MDETEAVFLSAGKIVVFEQSHYGYEVTDPFVAIGSGAAAALGALYVGATPVEAVRAAAKVDPYTGGRIVVKRL